MFSLSLNPPENESVPIDAFEAAIEQIEEKLGLTGQPRVIVFHEKHGRRHAHCVWSRIKSDTMTAINLPHFKLKLTDVSKQLYLEHGWKMPAGFLDKKNRNPLNFTLAEWQQAKRKSDDPKTVKATFQGCWQKSDSKKAFAQALEENGYYLAHGDKRGFVAVDWRGEVYSLSKWVGVRTKELKTRLGDMQEMPSVIEAQAAIAKCMTQKLDGFIQEVAAQKKKDAAPLIQARQEMVTRHQEERQALKNALEKRWQEETRQRAERLPKGLAALWQRLTGKYQRIRAINERKTALCLARHREQAQAVIDKQLIERQALHQKLSGILNPTRFRSRIIKQDIIRFAALTSQEPN
ncbi:MAG: relaxase/mobilization nuclease domain-containing protein [Alphaproteobacteria bacterium]